MINVCLFKLSFVCASWDSRSLCSLFKLLWFILNGSPPPSYCPGGATVTKTQLCQPGPIRFAVFFRNVLLTLTTAPHLQVNKNLCRNQACWLLCCATHRRNLVLSYVAIHQFLFIFDRFLSNTLMSVRLNLCITFTFFFSINCNSEDVLGLHCDCVRFFEIVNSAGAFQTAWLTACLT